jgi:hypothetical protein
MEGKLIDIFTDWLEYQKDFNSLNRFEGLIGLVGLLKSKGYENSYILEHGVDICQKLSDSSLPEVLRNCQEIIIACELKNVIELVTREVETQEETIELKPKEEVEIIETAPEDQIDIDLSELNLQIETDTSFLDSLRIDEDE